MKSYQIMCFIGNGFDINVLNLICKSPILKILNLSLLVKIATINLTSIGN